MNRVIFRDDPMFDAYWVKFLTLNKHASVFYTLDWMTFQRLYSADYFIKDLSFLILGPDEMPMAICPLYLENYAGTIRFAYRGEYLESLRTPLIGLQYQAKHGKGLEDEIYGTVEKLAAEYRVQKCNFLIDPLCAIYEDEHFNDLTRFGYIDASISTQIIDLNKSKETLWTELRKSYKALINKAEKTFEMVLMDSRNPDFEIHEQYRLLHIKAAGRVTRPVETFNTQFEMLKSDEATLIGIKYKERFVSFSYFIHFNKTAYYASEADDPEIEIPVTYGPLSQWKAMEYYKSRGFDYIELDNQQFGPQIFDHPCKKDLSISMFKRGFGGKTFPLFRGIKYFDCELLKKELTEYTELLIKSLSNDE